MALIIAVVIIFLFGLLAGFQFVQRSTSKRDLRYAHELLNRRDDLLDAECLRTRSLKKTLFKIMALRMQSDYTCPNHEGHCTIVKDVEVVINRALEDYHG